MSEILFILTTLYVAYVFYNTANQPKSAPRPAHKAQSPSQINVLTPNEIPAVVVIENKPVTAKPALDPETIHSVRNPLTGEVSKISSNYPFTKRWIKEALVSEGLLEKIYSTNELNEEVNEKIKQALTTLKTLPQYQA